MPTVQLPLLADRHTHPLLYAVIRDGVSLGSLAIGRADAIALIRERAQQRPDGLTIVSGWNTGRYSLSVADFDDLPPVVVLNLSLHGLLVNQQGRDWLRQHDALVVDHLHDHDWIERNLRRVLNVLANSGATVERLQAFYRWLLETHGVAYAEEMLLVSANEIRLFQEAGLLQRTRFWAAPELYDELTPELKLLVAGVKLFTDGALGVRTAALHEPYRDAPTQGLLLYSDGELLDLVARYRTRSVPLAIHAIGDRAIDQTVAVVAATQSSSAGVVRIEHAQLISEETAHRAKELGIQLCMQPNFSDDSVYYADRLPTGYPERNNPFRMLIDHVGYVAGEDLLFGSDGMPHGIHEGLRQALFPDPRYPQQRLSLAEFVAGYSTIPGPAGSLEVTINDEQRSLACRVLLR